MLSEKKTKSCMNCKNKIICYPYRELIRITPILAAITYNMTLKDELEKFLAGMCRLYV